MFAARGWINRCSGSSGSRAAARRAPFPTAASCSARPSTERWPEAARGLGGAEQLIRIERLRLWDNKPFLAEEIALPLSPFAPLMELDITELGPLLYPVYEKMCGQIVASAEEFLTINEADAATARLLNCRRGAPVVSIERHAFAHDRTPLEWRRTRGRGDQFSYRVEIH